MPCQDELPCAFEAVLNSNLFVTLPESVTLPKLIVIVALPHASPLVIEGDHIANRLNGKLATKLGDSVGQ